MGPRPGGGSGGGGEEEDEATKKNTTTTLLADLDGLALSTVLSAVPDPVAAAAAAASCTQCARVSPEHGLWRALSIDARGIPDSRAAPRGPRPAAAPAAPAAFLAAPRARTTRAAAAEVTRWLAPGRGDAAESLDLAWHPAVAASAAAADAALAGCQRRLAALRLDAGPAGALAALPKALMSAARPALASLAIHAASMDSGALTDARTGGPPPALAALEALSIAAALTGWAPLLPPPGRGGGTGGGGGGWGPAALARLRSLELVGSGLREVPPALACAVPALTRLVIVGARLGRDRWSAAATGASAAWSPTAALASVRGLVELALEDCGLETVPGEVRACTRLEDVRLAGNALRSFSCAALEGLARLRRVDLRDNALGAALPAALVGGWRDGVEVLVAGNPYLLKQEMQRRQRR